MTNTLASPGRTEPVQRSLTPPSSAGVLTLPLRLFLIAGWGRAAIEKVIDPDWWSARVLRRFLDEQRSDMLPWFGWLSDHVLGPFAPQIALTVLGAQLAIVALLLTNRRVRQALWLGIALNVCFVMAGRVNPSAFYLVMQATLLFALSRPIGEQIARRRATGWLIVAAAFVPFIRTVDPHAVIDDPASILAFVAAIAAITTIARVTTIEQVTALCERSAIGRRLRDSRLITWAASGDQVARR